MRIFFSVLEKEVEPDATKVVQKKRVSLYVTMMTQLIFRFLTPKEGYIVNWCTCGGWIVKWMGGGILGKDAIMKQGVMMNFGLRVSTRQFIQ